ncbi:DUF4116 domain-containing protein [Methylovorus glucosotrophus]|uniref:DUF4116 domain-containing protein n=1 Tax=Methylovorus glucosotrophus (strain SIP3-4) TaxID=582744 RepID=C6X7U8_METGS|nr:DUF4116 domain-containing protein [Methylovorus glucosotrophus]ACT51275.1 hypothetical protein Msip34_2033 [Methylovorus glucosotrophus SIP3-4]
MGLKDTWNKFKIDYENLKIEKIKKDIYSKKIQFSSLSEEQRGIIDIVNIGISENVSNFQYASDRLRNDKEFIMDHVDDLGTDILQYVSDELKNDKEFIISTLYTHDLDTWFFENNHFEFINDKLKDDKEFIMLALEKDTSILQDVSHRLRDDEEVINKVLKFNSDHFIWASDRLQNDYDFITNAYDSGHHILSYAGEDLNDNLKFAEFLISKNQTIEQISDRLKEDENLSKYAVEKNGSNLEFASPRLQDNEEIVKIAIGSAINNLEFASDRLRNNPDIALYALEQNVKQNLEQGYEDLFTSQDKSSSLHYTGADLKNDKDFLIKANLISDTALHFASPELQNDKEFVNQLIDAHSGQNEVFRYASDELQKDIDFVKSTIDKSSYNIRFAHESISNNKDIAIYTLEQEHLKRGNKISNSLALDFYSNTELIHDKTFLIESYNINHDRQNLREYFGEDIEFTKNIIALNPHEYFTINNELKDNIDLANFALKEYTKNPEDKYKLADYYSHGYNFSENKNQMDFKKAENMANDFRASIDHSKLEALHAEIQARNKTVEIPDTYITESTKATQEVKQTQINEVVQQTVAPAQDIKPRRMKL